MLLSFTYLELFIDSLILLPVIVGHGDLQRVRSCTGQLVKLVQADPDLSWKNKFMSTLSTCHLSESHHWLKIPPGIPQTFCRSSPSGFHIACAPT